MAAVERKERQAITADEHQRIVAREHNPEIRAYYQLLWLWFQSNSVWAGRRSSSPPLQKNSQECGQILRWVV
jgi:hypothetical protein